jgi:hypothetical protein
MEFIIPTWALSLLVVFVTIFGAFAVQRFIAFRNASVKFRAAITAELGNIYPTPSAWPKDIDAFLRAAFPKLQASVAEFNESLPKHKRAAFMEAWHAFHCSTGRKIDSQVYHHYMSFSSNPNPQATFHADVSRLLFLAREM